MIVCHYVVPSDNHDRLVVKSGENSSVMLFGNANYQVPQSDRGMTEAEKKFSYSGSALVGVGQVLRNGTTPAICLAYWTQGLCAYYDFDQLEWIFLKSIGHNLPHNEYSSSIIVMGQDSDTIFIVGGRGYFGPPTADTHLVTFDYRSATAKAEPGPDLPEPRSEACFVKINETHAVLAAGNHGYGVGGMNTSHFYHILEQTWSVGPDTNPAGHQTNTKDCILIHDIDRNHNGRSYVVLTGYYSHRRPPGTELLLLGVSEVYCAEGPEVPAIFSYLFGQFMAATPDGTGALLLGGENNEDNIRYKNPMAIITCYQGDCEWRMLRSKLKIPRSFSYAFLIPRSLGKTYLLHISPLGLK